MQLCAAKVLKKRAACRYAVGHRSYRLRLRSPFLWRPTRNLILNRCVRIGYRILRNVNHASYSVGVSGNGRGPLLGYWTRDSTTRRPSFESCRSARWLTRCYFHCVHETSGSCVAHKSDCGKNIRTSECPSAVEPPYSPPATTTFSN